MRKKTAITKVKSRWCDIIVRFTEGTVVLKHWKNQFKVGKQNKQKIVNIVGALRIFSHLAGTSKHFYAVEIEEWKEQGLECIIHWSNDGLFRMVWVWAMWERYN